MYSKAVLLSVLYAVLSSGSASTPHQPNGPEESKMGEASKSRSREVARASGFNKDIFKTYKELGKPSSRLVDEVDMDAHRRGIRADPHEWRERHDKRRSLERNSWKGRVFDAPPKAKKLARSADGVYPSKRTSPRGDQSKHKLEAVNEDTVG